MKLYVNEVSSNDIREEEVDGDTYLVVPTTFIKSMNLHRGYVPKREVEKATNRWESTPVITDHPRDDDGRLISVNDPDSEEPPFGELKSPDTHTNGDAKTAGELWLNVDAANEIGGESEKVIEALRNREKLSVSSAYGGIRLPSGEYDGEHRDKVLGNLRPDHIAILRNKTGRCSLSDGCFAGPNAVPAANSNVGLVVNAVPDDRHSENGDGKGTNDSMETSYNALFDARRPEYDGTTSGSWSAPTFTEYVEAFGFEADNVTELTRQQRQRIAETTLLGDADADTLENLRVFPVVEPESMNLSENALIAVLGGRGAQADIPESSLDSARSVARSLLEEEFDRDVSANASFLARIAGILGFNEVEGGDESAESDTGNAGNNEMPERTEELVEMGFNAENLPDEETDCFDLIYEKFAGNEESEDEEEENESPEAEESGEPEEDTEETEPAVTFESKEDFAEAIGEVVDERVEQALAANEEKSEKSELADEIIANSEDHDEDSREALMDSDKSVLKSLRDAVASPEPSPNFRASRAVSANTETKSDGMPSLSAQERIAEKNEADD